MIKWFKPKTPFGHEILKIANESSRMIKTEQDLIEEIVRRRNELDDGGDVETREILDDEETLRELVESELDIAAGRLIDGAELRAEDE